MKKYILLAMVALGVSLQAAHAKIQIVASLPDLGSIASSIGGDYVEVLSIARANSDPHSVEVLPSYMVRASRADIYLKVGLSLDQWADGIIAGSRNPKLTIVDCSKNVPVLEKPTTKVDASLGDVHPEGNPHYWLDPRNGIIVAQTIHDAFVYEDPDHRAEFDANLEKFTADINTRLQGWISIAGQLPSHEIITYHSSWAYFANAFNLNIAAKMEPIPGIPPSASHLADLVDIIKSQHVGLALQELYFSDDAAKYLERETGIRVIKASPSCDCTNAGDYQTHFDHLFAALKGS